MSYPKFISQHFLGVVIVLQVVMYVSLFLNFSLVRAAVGIFYLTFIPGFIFIKIIKHDFETPHLIVFSAGFSLAFLMLAGLVINEFGPLVGISFPLSVLPLSLFINTLILAATGVAYLRRSSNQAIIFPKTFGFHPSYLILALIPILSIVGAYFVNTTGNNLFLLITILSIAAVFTLGVFYRESSRIYPFAIVMIALALLFQTSLISNYLLSYGGDSTAEYYIFRTTQINSVWNPIFHMPTDQGLGRFNAMLSITVLPTIYSNMLGIDPTWVFKAVFPFIFALVPLGAYLLWQPYIGKKLAFFAAFLFMAQSTFFTEMAALNRQMVGELFFVLLLLLLMNKSMNRGARFLSFGVLGFALIFSHYALAQIFLFLIFIAWAISVFYIKRPSLNLQLSMIVFFFVAMFAWYIYTSGAVVFDSFMTFAQSVTSQMGDFFNPASRGQTVLAGLGLAQSPSLMNTVSRAFAYLTELFIALGVGALLLKKTKFRFEREYFVFSVLAIAGLIALTVVPGLANTLNMTRFYHILLILLAPFCIIGMYALTQLIFRHEKTLVVSALVVVVLVPYFLFQTNLAYEVAGADSWSVSLSGYRMDPVRLHGTLGYIDTYSVHGAQWVSSNVPYQYRLFSDDQLYTSLTAYGLVYRGYVKLITNTTVVAPGEYVYLSYLSVNYQDLLWNGTLPTMLNQTNVIYSNGGSEVYCNPEK